MLEDFKELRRIIDRFIAKYEKNEYYFEHDPRIVEIVKERDNFALDGDERLKELGRELLKIREEEKDGKEKKGWEGNDIY